MRICLSVCVFVCLSICLSLSLSVCLSDNIYTCVCGICVCVCLFVLVLYVRTSVYLHLIPSFLMILFRFFSSLYYHYDNCCICVSVYLCVFLCVCVVCNLFSVLTLCTHNYYCSYDIMFMCVFMCVFLCVCVLFTYMCVLHYVLIIFLRHSHSQFRSTVFVKIIFLSFSLFFSILITLKITILIFAITSTIYL